VRHAPLQLLRNPLCDNPRVDFRVLHLDDVHTELLAAHVRHLLQASLECIDVGTTPTDDDTRLRRHNSHVGLLREPLNVDARNAGAPQGTADLLPKSDVLSQQLGILLAFREPLGLPVLYDPQPKADWIYFAAQIASLPKVRLAVLKGRR